MEESDRGRDLTRVGHGATKHARDTSWSELGRDTVGSWTRHGTTGHGPMGHGWDMADTWSGHGRVMNDSWDNRPQTNGTQFGHMGSKEQGDYMDTFVLRNKEIMWTHWF